MAALSDDQNAYTLNSALYQRIVSQFRGDWVERLSVDQMFVLIDGVLPFEACLYYQVLPLFLEGNRLHLGMVSLDDTSASDYARRIISYLNYSLVCHAISSEAMRVVLTAYLNYVGNQPAIGRSVADSVSFGHHRHSARSNQQLDASERLTLVVDSPDDLYAAETGEMLLSPTAPPPPVDLPQFDLEDSDLEDSRAEFWEGTDGMETDGMGTDGMAQAAPPILPSIYAPQIEPTLIELPDEPEPEVEPEGSYDFSAQDVPPMPAAELTFKTTQPPLDSSIENGKELEAEDLVAPSAEPPLPEENPSAQRQSEALPPSSSSNQALPILQVHANYLSSPVEVLATLPPTDFLQELLARVLLGGIGRLYFECHPQHGRLIWSQNGVLQSVMDKVTLPVFAGLLLELKRMAKVNPTTTGIQQTEIEYLYERNRVLLRFRFMPGTHGEEATVQVLRGAALKFYQQQQLSYLKRDAVSIAKQLQNKLNEIRVQAYSDPSLLDVNPEMLPKLNQIFSHLEEQLDDLGIHLKGHHQ